ncbi:hypothetical protein PRABACTJOHN_03188 [Parabacteroides johnsonii DSM 18315]|uniref:Uncharacterized protein n=1 Tax=Parabacteroides johnsonii DSM 18315 TaxID=537006 RepID=B7BDR3_9BACT|nr:hypothetical protein PRABACTJOHN_03188 [Parabacteroides johnsonii DSM 18315]
MFLPHPPKYPHLCSVINNERCTSRFTDYLNSRTGKREEQK